MSRPMQQPIIAPEECFSTDLFIKEGCRDACTFQTCPGSLSYWSYLPSYTANGLYMGIFIVSLLAFLVTNVKQKKAFMGFSVTMVLGNVLEIVGYAGRILAHRSPFSSEPFLMQIIGLTLAPAFYAASIYFCLSRIITSFGADNSRIPPERYPRIFIACDVLALILQAAGGGLAASAKLSDSDPSTGANILIAGLSFQVFTMVAFIGLATDFAVRTWLRTRSLGKEALNEDYAATRQTKMFRGFLVALAFATLCIFSRCVYRVIELAEGYGGHLAKTQDYFIVLEGAVVAAAVLSLNVFHPAFCFPREDDDEEEETEDKLK